MITKVPHLADHDATSTEHDGFLMYRLLVGANPVFRLYLKRAKSAITELLVLYCEMDMV